MAEWDPGQLGEALRGRWAEAWWVGLGASPGACEPVENSGEPTLFLLFDGLSLSRSLPL